MHRGAGHDVHEGLAHLEEINTHAHFTMQCVGGLLFLVNKLFVCRVIGTPPLNA